MDEPVGLPKFGSSPDGFEILMSEVCGSNPDASSIYYIDRDPLYLGKRIRNHPQMDQTDRAYDIWNLTQRGASSTCV